MVLRRGRVSGWVEVGFETSPCVMRGGEGGGDTIVFVDHFVWWRKGEVWGGVMRVVFLRPPLTGLGLNFRGLSDKRLFAS